VIAGDGAARTYVLTGDARELAAARGEFSEMSDHLESLKALVRDDEKVRAQVEEFGKFAESHAEAALKIAAARQDKAPAEIEAMLQADQSLGAIQEARRLAARIRAGQFELLDQRDQAAYRQAHATRWIVGSCVVLNILLLAVVAWLVRDDIATRRKLAATLQDANDVLEAKVKERTRELSEANARLTAENNERKWSAQSLEHQLRYNQIIINATTDLVFVLTKTLAITRINPAVMQRTGWPEEEILGRPLSAVVQAAAGLDASLRAGREVHHQLAKLSTQSGAVLPATFTLLPVRDNDKVVGGVLMLQVSAPTT
jgi:PAS domain-containing protein